MLLFIFLLVLKLPLDRLKEVGSTLLKVGMAEDVLGWVFSRLVKAIHVELPYKGVNIAMPEESWQNIRLESIRILDGELPTRGEPVNCLAVLLILDGQ